MKIVIYSLGCKVTQYESECLAQELINLGYEISTKLESADCFVVNTCAVTNEAERKSRNTIAKFNKLNNTAPIFVMGCASQNNSEQFLNKPNVVFVLGSYGKNKVANLIDIYLKQNTLNGIDTTENKNYENFSAFYINRTRAYIKVQDGCNNFCSYCLIPFVRGRSRSRDLNEIVNEARILDGFVHEIVLVGINISDYQIGGEKALDKLLYSLKDLNARIRIGSLEVNVITEEFLKTLASCPNFCPHFHLSMQSGCTRTLKQMNRHYTAEEYLEKIELIKQYFPNAIITTDIIVGFPEETDDDFKETTQTVKKAEFFSAHIFPYSIREGTKAQNMKQVDGKIKKQREEMLVAIQKQNHTKVLNSFIGKIQNMIIEEIEGDYFTGHTELYIKCYLPKTSLVKAGDLIKVKILKEYQDGALVEIISD